MTTKRGHQYSAAATLACQRLPHGLRRVRGGFATKGGDPSDVIHARTIRSLAAAGLAELSADGRTAQAAATVKGTAR